MTSHAEQEASWGRIVGGQWVQTFEKISRVGTIRDWSGGTVRREETIGVAVRKRA